MIRRLKCAIEQRIGEIFLRMRTQNGYVLMFHNISDKCNGNRNISISTKTFVKLIKEIKKREFISDIETIKKGENRRNQIILTFDDAFEGCYTNAYPVLRKEDIPFVIFMTGEYIDKPGYMTGEMLKEMAENPLCTIGSHLYHHVMTRSISQDELKYEIEKNNDILRDFTGRKIKYMAFPYGSSYAVSRENMLYAKKYFELEFITWHAGYNSRMVSKTGIVPRININEDSARRYLNGEKF